MEADGIKEKIYKGINEQGTKIKKEIPFRKLQFIYKVHINFSFVFGGNFSSVSTVEFIFH